MGFEPTRGDPIGLAGRRLNHSAKVSLARTPLDSRAHTIARKPTKPNNEQNMRTANQHAGNNHKQAAPWPNG